MPSTIAQSRLDLWSILDTLTENGIKTAAILPAGRYDDVQLIVCTEPYTGEWHTFTDKSGSNTVFTRDQDVEKLSAAFPITVLHQKAS